MVLSFFQVAEADFSFLAEEEPVAARAEAAVLEPALAWLPASVEEERVCFEAEALAAGARAAELVADVAAAELVADAPVVLAAGALVAELVAGVAAAELGPAYFEVEASVADALPAELVGGAAAEPELACSALAEAPAAGELVAELVAGARAAALLVWLQADWQAVDCDWAAAELEQELAARAVRRAVDCDSVEHFAERQPADERRYAVVAARRWVVRPLARGVEPERGALELPRRWVCLAGSVGLRQRRRACRD